MATPAKRALDFDQLEQKSRTDTISEAIKEVDVTPVDDTKVNTNTTNEKAVVEETSKTKSPVNKGSKTKIMPINFANAAASKAPASTITSSSRRPATTPTRSQSLTSKISNGPIKTSEVKKAVLPTAAAAASKEAMTKSTSSSDSVSSSSTAVRNYPLFLWLDCFLTIFKLF